MGRTGEALRNQNRRKFDRACYDFALVSIFINDTLGTRSVDLSSLEYHRIHLLVYIGTALIQFLIRVELL